MEHFTSNGFGLAKVSDLEIRPLPGEQRAKAAPCHHAARAPTAPRRVARSGKLHIFPKLSSFLALFSLSWLLPKPCYYFKDVALQPTSYKVLSSTSRTASFQPSLRPTKAIAGAGAGPRDPRHNQPPTAPAASTPAASSSEQKPGFNACRRPGLWGCYHCPQSDLPSFFLTVNLALDDLSKLRSYWRESSGGLRG